MAFELVQFFWVQLLGGKTKSRREKHPGKIIVYWLLAECTTVYATSF